ncbi:hypothetical protein BDV19DRAFT_383449 [Aspergillus venezuelensis]
MASFNRYTEGKSVVDRWGSAGAGKTFAITGATPGSLGALTILRLAATRPARVILLVRDERKVYDIAREISEISPDTEVLTIYIELDDFGSVTTAASEVRSRVNKIDVLINNAGVMAIPWATNKNGIEKTLAVNHLGHFLLTNLLMPLLSASGPGARIVNLTSGAYGMTPFCFQAWNFADGKTYNSLTAYGQSKTANILFTVGLADRFGQDGIFSYAVHPGYIPSTAIVSHLAELDFSAIDAITRENTGFAAEVEEEKTREQGVATTLVAALSPDLVAHNGVYLRDCQVCETRGYAKDRGAADKLWRLSEELTGVKVRVYWLA